MQAPSEEHLVAQWKWRGRQRAIGAGAYERYCTLGLYAFGGNAPNVSKASSMKEACIAVNRFLRHRFPHGTWTSIAVLLNPRIGLHRDMRNMVGKLNHAITLGTFNGGRVWIEDEEGTSIETTTKNGKVRELKGTWIDIHDRPTSFNARRFHKIEPHEGHMLAAYTPQSFERCSDEVRSKLKKLAPEGLCVEAVFFSPFQPLFRSPQTWMRQIAAVASRHCCNFTDLPRTKYEAVCLPVSQAFAGVSTS